MPSDPQSLTHIAPIAMDTASGQLNTLRGLLAANAAMSQARRISIDVRELRLLEFRLFGLI